MTVTYLEASGSYPSCEWQRVVPLSRAQAHDFLFRNCLVESDNWEIANKDYVVFESFNHVAVYNHDGEYWLILNKE